MTNENIELGVFNKIISSLSGVDPDTQSRILQSVITFLKLNEVNLHKPFPVSNNSLELNFSDREERSPKEFLLDKNPKTDIQRIACLAYYLSHYRNTPHFKTLDLSKLNTEAAQPKFSNPGFAVTNAANKRLLVPAGGGSKQLSALGEQYVQALPDLNAAKAVLERAQRTRKKSQGKKTPQQESK
ncbi:MAG: hypothetical protein M0R48_04290 [Candidatus Omnitrophica bacterium]|jgi:hypothetical protein|nr:hypothetical protein [Candidatus Omnitrophota bacterium]